MNLTKSVLRRPITTILCVLCLIVFGIMSVTSSKLELTPEINMSMMIVSTVYVGASPEDINEIITKPVEEEVGTLNGVKSVTSSSSENMSLVLLEYEYGMDMDKAYSDLKKKMDNIDLPDDAQTPIIMEMNMNDQPIVVMTVNNKAVNNQYNYVKNILAPEFEKLASVASVDISGGQEEYIQIELIPEKMQQYHLTMSTVASAIGSADFAFPAGETTVGSQTLSVSAGVSYDTAESLKQIPIPAGNKNVIYLEDIANIRTTQKDAAGISRYNGEDIVSVSIKRNQKSSAVDVSEDVNRVIRNMTAADPDLEIQIVSDTSEMITNSLKSVANTMVMAILISMAIIFLFFGDLKASLIVGTSIPVSILAALVLVWLMGFSLNVITLGSLVLGVGMIVDNSIVVLESCFRATKGKKGFREYRDAALEGSGIVIHSIIGSTATTCVVFLPLAFLQGLSGQMFKPLGFTIVFCMVASLISAMTIVPLCYTFYRPVEKEEAPVSRLMEKVQNGYRNLMDTLLPKRKTVMGVTVVMLILSFVMATQLRFEMMPASDEGTIAVTVETRQGLSIEKVDNILQKVEGIVTADENLDSYILTYGSSGLSMGGSAATLTAYLKDDRNMETSEVIKQWKPLLSTIEDCNITLEESNTMSAMMGTSADTFEVILKSAQYEELKEVSDKIAKELEGRAEVARVHSSLENAAPLVKIHVDPVLASAEGLAPVQVASMVNQTLSGVEATTLDVNGEDISVMVEYPAGDYETIDQLQGINLMTPMGTTIALTDIADIKFEDSPVSITRIDKQYQVTLSAEYTNLAEASTRETLMNEAVYPNLTQYVEIAKNTVDEMMIEEFTALIRAIAIAVFLIFVVMAAQFESPKFSIMVMTTIPFSLIGSFGLLYLTDVSISMPSLLGFLMLVGTVVNNGILYVDTVNQYRQEMDMNTALKEAGATRLRPILMTTLTTIVSMIPMAMAYGENGELMQGLALVNVGGLLASTVLALLMLPVYYSIMNKRRKQEPAYD